MNSARKKLYLFGAIVLLLSMTLVAAEESATSKPSVCCERTKEGAICINTDQESCNPSYKSSPTSCETTSYCKLGTCYDSDEGICMENTPQQVCTGSGGTWDEREIEEVPQCSLGCCIIADQAAFVPLVRCKKLATLYGVETDYRTDIGSELECIATAQAQDEGACVFERDFERVCSFTTRGECTDGEFFEDLLCSAEELNTANAKQAATGCYRGDVYWFDSEGQRENVYASDSDLSWNDGRVADPDEICNPNDGSNKNCGNCEYLLGTRCAEDDSLFGSNVDHFCKRNECVDREGNTRLNGESWCVNDGLTGDGKDTVGSRYYREICVDGEVRVEPCADFRNEICISGAIETDQGLFGTSACRVNRWQDCTGQTDEDDCTNGDRRDCIWFDSVEGMLLGSTSSESRPTTFSNPTAGDTPAFQNPTASPSFSDTREEDDDDEEIEGVCVPNFPPGLEFWKEGSAQTICNQASARCDVVYEKGLLDSWSCKENCHCLEDDWGLEANRICSALGDCGGYINYQREYTDDGYEWKVDDDDKEFSPNAVNKIKGGFTGLLIERITE